MPTDRQVQDNFDWPNDTAERNRLIHTHVMGNPEYCTGKVHTQVVPVAHMIKPSFVLYNCDSCNITGSCDTLEDVPVQHIAQVVIPNYCKDMNDAMLVATHPRFSHCYISHVQRVGHPGKWSVSLYSVDKNGERIITSGEVCDALPVAICDTAYKAVVEAETPRKKPTTKPAFPATEYKGVDE